MLKKVFIFPVMLLIFWCCSVEEHDFKSEGIITGVDNRECNCCGGYYIDIADSTYRFYAVPPGSNLYLEHPHFPIYVKLDWHKDPNACLGDEIIVERIEER